MSLQWDWECNRCGTVWEGQHYSLQPLCPACKCPSTYPRFDNVTFVQTQKEEEA